jgi:hypothetical protein
MCVGEGYFFFFLPVFFFFAFLAFLAMLPSVIPKLVQCKSNSTSKDRVHHNCKIDTARFEEGKRRSCGRSLRLGEPFSRCVDAIGDTACCPAS